MNLNQINAVPVLDNRKRKRVGRGTSSGHGKTCGRGHKGQKSRSGYSRKIGHEGGQMPLLRRLPKRGFSNARFRDAYEVVNLGDLARFKKGAVVTVESLREAGLVGNGAVRVKVLAGGKLEAAVTVKAHAFSKEASAKIAAAGGKAELVEGAPAA